jgi:hypothetical protein
MSYDFPASPAENDEYAPPTGGQTYIYKAPRWLVKGIPPTSAGGGGGGLAEAPIDGAQYARKNAAWTTIIIPPADWGSITSKPITFPPTVPIAWTDVSGKPLAYPPALPIAETDVTNLVSDLAAKLPTASYTAADVLTKIKTVDGSGSGLDADLLDAQDSAYFLNLTNATSTLPAAAFNDTAHGVRAGGTLHPVVTTTVAGFMSAADKVTFNAINTTYAPLVSPILTGTPVAPTATAGTSTTQLATTAFVTTADALKVAKAGDSMSGNLLPNATGTLDLGSATFRWRTVYTSDLSLKNDVGDWTIVEGEDDLFLYNNKRGKTYKFALVEVDEAPPKKV